MAVKCVFLATLMALCVIAEPLPQRKTPVVAVPPPDRMEQHIPAKKPIPQPAPAVVISHQPVVVTPRKDAETPIKVSIANPAGVTPQAPTIVKVVAKPEPVMNIAPASVVSHPTISLNTPPPLAPTVAAALTTSTESNLGGGGGGMVLVSVSMGSGKSYCDLTEGNHKEYAQRHGYAYKRYYDSDAEALGVTSEPKWGKLRGLQKQLTGAHKYVVWIDCDMVVTNKDVTFDRIASRYSDSPSTSLIIARDSYYKKMPKEAAINSGVFLLKDNAWSKEFVETVISKGKVEGAGLVDQPRIIRELVERGEMNANPTSEIENHAHTSIIPQRVMNSFVRDGYDDDSSAKWQPGDFIAHVCGMDTGTRQSKIKNLLNTATKSMHMGLLRGAASNDVMSLIQASDASSTSELLSDTVLLKPATLDLIEDNWKRMVISALVEQDWATVAQLQV